MELSAVEQARLIRERSITSTEIVEAYLQRIDALNERVHAYVHVYSESALDRASVLDREARLGSFRGPLHGVPYAAKDIIQTRYDGTTASAEASVSDAEAVLRLGDAGLVLIGKTTTYELAMGPPSLADRIPPARNPWNMAHIPGGSSSGSAAATAACMCPFALGTDTGGSVRHPAAHCGVVGLKPSYAAVSIEGVVPLSWTLDHLGVLSGTVDDASAVLRILAPNLADASYSQSGPGPLADIDVIVPIDLLEESCAVAADVLSAYHDAVGALGDLGARIVERELGIRGHEAVLSVILLSEAAAYHREHFFARPEDFGVRFRERMAPGYLFSAVDYIKAQAVRTEMIRLVDEALGEGQVLVTPTMPATAASFDDFARLPRDLAPPPFTSLFSLTGHPAVSVPNGLSKSGLPMGLQLAARRGNDLALLGVAKTFERVKPWRRCPPLAR